MAKKKKQPSLKDIEIKTDKIWKYLCSLSTAELMDLHGTSRRDMMEDILRIYEEEDDEDFTTFIDEESEKHHRAEFDKHAAKEIEKILKKR